MKMTTRLKLSLLSLAFLGGTPMAFAAPANGGFTGAVAHPSRSAQMLPAALQPALYQALAKAAGPAYRFGRNGCVTLPKSSLRACFLKDGVRFDLPFGDNATQTQTPTLDLRLVAYGRGVNLAPVTPAAPDLSGNRVSYHFGNLSEWWRVLPVGFEQGFTLAKRPAGRGELTLALGASGKASQEGDALAWGGLRYGRLVVTDAKGKIVPSRLRSEGARILIAVNDTHAAYPLTVDPLVWLEQKVISNDGITGLTEFGRSVAVSGNTAIIGEPFATINGNVDQGTAYVFTKSDGVWTETQQLLADNGAQFDLFGISVALDGSTAVIGADQATPRDNFFQGAAYVFTKSGGNWGQTAELIASDGAASDQFGAAVALDGTTALVGALFADVNGNGEQGAAYVFTESGGTWSQTQKLVSNDGATNDQFGTSVVLDGSTALIGAPAANAIQGAAYVFTKSGETWSQAQKLTASDGVANDTFGRSVALEGDTALIGAYDVAVDGNTDEGAVYVFDGSSGTWAQTQKLVESSGTAFDQFGFSIALDGATAVIGTGFGTVNGNSGQGKAYVFDQSGGTWSEGQRLVASDGVAGDQFGYSVAFDGDTSLIGAPNRNANQGAAYFYGQSDLGLNVSAPQTVSQGQQYVSQTTATNNGTASSPAVTATMAVPATASFVSATASQGSCGEDSGVITCDFGPINGNAGTATANVTLKATGNTGDTIENTASIAKATPPLTASALTTISENGACPESYTEYDGSLNPGKLAHSPIYHAPAGQENAILAGPEGFQLYVLFQNAQGRKVLRIPGNEVHRRAPAGTYTWVVKAGDTGGAYTLCILHP